MRKTNGSEAGGSDLVKAGGAFKLLNYLPKFLKILKTLHLGFRYRRIDRVPTLSAVEGEIDQLAANIPRC